MNNELPIMIFGSHDKGVLVFGAHLHPQRTSFLIMEHAGWDLKQIATLMANLPLRFHLKSADDGASVEPPLEVYAEKQIVSIYPKSGTRISSVSMQSWEFHHITSKMRVDNIWTEDDLIGCDQIERRHRFRACVHFNPAILGVTQFPGNIEKEIELDIMRDSKLLPKRSVQ